MAAPIGGSASDYYSYNQLVQINQIMDGNEFKGPGKEAAEAKPAQTDTLDVIIISKPGAYKGAAEPGQIEENLKGKGVEVNDSLKSIGGVEAKIKPDQLDKLKNEGYMVYDNSPRNLVPSMPKIKLLGNTWEMPAIDPITMTGANALQAKGFDGTGKTVAVVDSGFQKPDFNLKTWKDIAGFSNKPEDKVGHGTHVAGCVNQMAPQAEIVAVRVMGPDGTGRPSDIVKGIEWVVDNQQKYGIDVMNLSLGAGPDGFPYYLDPINMAVEKAIESGIAVVNAAGNSGPDAKTIGSPADDPEAITVGAGFDRNRVSDFSSRGPTDDGIEKPDIVAPGEYIVSWNVPDSQMGKTAAVVETIRHMSPEQLVQLLVQKPQLIEAFGLPEDILEHPAAEVEKLVKNSLPPMYLPDKDHIAAPGTSFASPIVAGIVADLREANPKLTPGEIKKVLLDTADNMGAQYGKYDQGKGWIDGKEAMEKATGQK